MLKDTVLGELISNLASITERDLIENAFNDSVLAQMYDLNQEQLDKGLFSDGSKTGEYAPYTIQIKQLRGQTWQYMTFFDTGYTRSTIEYQLGSSGIDIDMDDRHDLLEDYSINILGLTDNSINYINEEITENIIDFIASKATY